VNAVTEPPQSLGCPIRTLRPVNAVTEPPQAMARMSPHHVETHRQPQVHETGGLGEMLWGTRLVPPLRRRPQGPGPGRHGLETSEHHQHQGSLAHLMGLRASGNLARFSQLEDSGACPTSGTRCRPEYSSQRGLG
jgi:hypothetical protein